MKLNIETVQKVAEVAGMIGEGSNIQIHSHRYESYEEAKTTAFMVSETLGLDIKENHSRDYGWFEMKDALYCPKIEITLYYPLESGVVNA